MSRRSEVSYRRPAPSPVLKSIWSGKEEQKRVSSLRLARSFSVVRYQLPPRICELQEGK